MRISTTADYAVRAALELGAHSGRGPVKAGALAGAQAMPVPFLVQILSELRRLGARNTG